ncbi:MAG: DUF4956 domain-containing protein [Lachnospiraceae bacterium]|nr:DUF4956 domain-containing protein [Lachnospiraceae bacterium]
MSVKDFIKKSILESDMYNQAIDMSTILTIAADLILALLMGLLIYMIYKKLYMGVVYSRNFAISLVGMTVLTCMITLAISTNIVISLGMVGALSIVRYRTAIKEPLDLMYMFWAITTGITVGASMYILVVVASLMMIVLIFIFSRKMNFRRSYIVVVHYQGDTTGDEVLRVMNKVHYSIRSKVLRGDDVELTLQVYCRTDNMVFAEKVRSIAKVKDITILEYNGEYHG